MKPATRDALHFLRILLRPRRLVNALALYGSYQLSRVFKRNLHIGQPMAMSIEPTTACNLGCPQCPSGLKQFSRPTGRMTAARCAEILDQAGPELAYLILYFQGEPYLNKEFCGMIRAATDRGIYTATSTNAHFLDPETCRKTVEAGLSRMIISIDGSTQESYAHYRIHGSLNKVLDGTRNMLEARRAAGSRFPYLIWQFIVFRHNEHEIEAVKQLAAEYEVDDLVIKSAQVYDYENGEDWIPLLSNHTRYTYTEEGIRLKGELTNRCWKMWHSCVVTWDGRVVPCCFDKDATHSLGELNEQSFRTIWRGPAYSRFRQQILKGRSQIDICRNCSEGLRVFEKQVL